MTDPEYVLWLEMNGRLRDGGAGSPCADCPRSWAEAMRAISQCDGEPGPAVGRPRESEEPAFFLGRTFRRYETEEQRLAARRSSWRSSSARRRAAVA